MPQATIKLRGDVRSAHAGMTRIDKDVKQLMTGVDGLDGKLSLITDKMPGASKAFQVMTKGGMVGLAIAGVAELGSRIVDLSAESLKVQAAFNNLQFGLNGASEAAMGLVDNFTLANAQVRALELGAVSNKAEFETLIEVGTKMGLVMGGDAAKGVEDLTTALSRQSGPILDNLGIQLTMSQAIEEQTEFLGRQLTADEKATAFRVVALRKAAAAAKEKNFEDTAALKIQQELVAIENIRLKALGGAVTAQTAVNEALDAMGESLGSVDVMHYGDDMERITNVLREYGLTVEDAGGKVAIHNQVLKKQNELYAEQARVAREAAEASELAAWQKRLDNAKATTHEAKFQLQLSQAYGMSEGAIFTQKKAILEAERESLMVEKERSAEAEKQLQLNDEAMRLLEAREATRLRLEGAAKKKSGGKSAAQRRKEEEAKLNESISAALDEQRARLERNIEILEAYGESSFRARQRLIEFDELGGTRQEKEQARHELTLLRIEEGIRLEEEAEKRREELQKRREAAMKRTEKLLAERNKREKKMLAERHAQIDKITSETTDGATQLTSVIVSASKKRGEAGKAEVAEYAAGQQRIMLIAAAKHLALGTAAAVTYRPIKAAAEFTAAGIAGAKAAAFGVVAGSLGSSESGEDGFSGGGGGFGGSGTPNTSGLNERPDSAGTAPVSPLETAGGSVGQGQAPQAQGGNTIIVEGAVIDAGKLKEILDDGPTGDGTGFKGGMS